MRKGLLVLIAGLMICSQGIVQAEDSTPLMYKANESLGPTNTAIGDNFLPPVLVPRVPSDGGDGAGAAPAPIKNKNLRVGSYQGYVDSMSHKGSVDLLNLGLKGQVTLYMTGVAMTEPAVLAGLQAANEFSNQQMERSMSTYQLVAEVAKNSGSQPAKQLLAELSKCITDKATANKSHDVGLIVDSCLSSKDAEDSKQEETPKRRADGDAAGMNNLFVNN